MGNDDGIFDDYFERPPNIPSQRGSSLVVLGLSIVSQTSNNDAEATTTIKPYDARDQRRVTQSSAMLKFTEKQAYSARIFRLANCIWCGSDRWGVCFILLTWCIMWYINMTWVRDNMPQQNEFRAGSEIMKCLHSSSCAVCRNMRHFKDVTLILMAANYYANKVTNEYIHIEVLYINCSISRRYRFCDEMLRNIDFERIETRSVADYKIVKTSRLL